MYAFQKSHRRASAREQIDIKAIKDAVLVLSGERYRVALSVSPINFELKSEDEQDVIIDTYESFLNSIGCPLQVLVRTREIDLDKYLGDLEASKEYETEVIYKEQLENYSEFVRSLITTNKVLSRSFYVVVPYMSDGKIDFRGVREELNLRVDIVRKGLARLGMASHVLDNLALIDLFYSFYSPESARLQPLSAQALALLHTEYIRRGAAHV